MRRLAIVAAVLAPSAGRRLRAPVGLHLHVGLRASKVKRGHVLSQSRAPASVHPA
jgi:hypothetical protein